VNATVIELPALERGLDPDVVDERLAAIALACEESDAAAAFYLHEVETRKIFLGFSHPTTARYAEARHGLAPDLTWRLLRAARVCERSPVIRAAFERGDVPLYKMDPLKNIIGLDEDERWAAMAADKKVSKEQLLSAVQRRLGEEPDDTYVWLRMKVPPSLHDLIEDGVEKASRYAGARISRAEAFEIVFANWRDTLIDPSERDPSLTRLDPVIDYGSATSECDDAVEAESAVGASRAAEPEAPPAVEREPEHEPEHEREGAPATERDVPAVEERPDASWRSPTRVGDSPMTIAERFERDARFRLEVLWTAGWRCAGCGARCELEVDHIRTRALNPRLRWDVTNGCVLCASCHAAKTTGLLRVERLPDGSLAFARPSRWKRPPERGP